LIDGLLTQYGRRLPAWPPNGANAQPSCFKSIYG